jgi:lysylphosphatidylglycerol synthetase-like protein (DUF2156 family)
MAIAIVGIIDLVSASTPPYSDRLRILLGWVPLGVPRASAVLAFALGVVLVVLAAGVRRGQRRAWTVAIAALGVSAALNLAKGLDVEEALASMVVATYLLRRSDCFRAASCPQRTRRGIVAAFAGGVLATLVGGLAVWIGSNGGDRPSIGWSLVAAGERLVGRTSHGIAGHGGNLLTSSMAVAGVLIVGVATWLVFRPVRDLDPGATAVAADPRAREVVTGHGSGTLDYFALRHDKLHFVSGESLVAYSLQSGVCLVSPDPIGPADDRMRIWQEFRHHAEAHGWPIAVLGVSEEWLPIYEADGMRSMYVGDEAIVDVTSFTIDGGKMKGLRHAVNRALKAGYRFELRDPSCLEPELEVALERVLTGSRRGGVERGYAMTLGRVFDPNDRGLLLGIAFEPSGEPAAFCQFVPAPGINGWSLDLMRRSDRDHPNSISDFVVVSTLLVLKEWGAGGLALNFATLRAVMSGDHGDAWTTRAQAAVARWLSSTMQIESLWRHNAKYRPGWQPRYAVYSGIEHWVPSAIAVARAESFAELPMIGRFFDRRPVATPLET